MRPRKRIVIVLGAYRSGTSCLAGVLNELGVAFGPCMEPGPANPRGFWEHHVVRSALMAGFDQGRCAQLCSDELLIQTLRDWRKSFHRSRGAVIGLKHPLLCVLGPAMERAFAGETVHYIATERPVQEIVKSLEKCNWVWSRGADLQGIVTKMLTERDRFLGQRPHERVHLHELLHQTEATIHRLTAFLGTSPSPGQLASARRLVDPSAIDLEHHSSRRTEQRRAGIFGWPFRLWKAPRR